MQHLLHHLGIRSTAEWPAPVRAMLKKVNASGWQAVYIE
jgi:hypothetical protein